VNEVNAHKRHGCCAQNPRLCQELPFCYSVGTYIGIPTEQFWNSWIENKRSVIFDPKSALIGIADIYQFLFYLITLWIFERKFVILGAKKFVHILEAYEIKKPGHVVFGELYTSKIEGIAKNVNWQTVTIKYNSKAINAIIPFSFPRRDLPNAHQKMAEYGKLCFESFTTNFQIS